MKEIRDNYVTLTNKELKLDYLVSKLNTYYNSNNGINSYAETIDFRFFTIDNFSNTKYKSKDDYVKYLEDEYGKKDAELMIEQSIIKYNTYINEKQERMDTTSPYDFIEWDKRNNPLNLIVHYDNHFNIDKSNAYDIYRFYGYKYIHRIPKNVMNDKDENRFYDSSFKTITTIPELNEFYNFYIDKMTEFKSYLPQYITDKLYTNFLPVVQKDVMDSWVKDGFKGVLAYYGKKGINLFTSNEPASLLSKNESNIIERNPNTAILVPSIPVLYTKNNLDVGERSFDLPKLLEMFGAMALHYSYKSTIEDKVQLLYSILEDAEEIQMHGNNPLYKYGRLLTVSDGATQLKQSVKYTIEALLYGIKRETQTESTTKVFGYNPVDNLKKSRKALELENRRDEIEANDNLDEDERDELLSSLEEQYKQLNGKNLVFTKGIDVINSFTTLKGLALNLPSGLNNLAFGLFSNMVYANGRTDFTPKEYFKAVYIVLKAFTTRKGLTKLKNLIQNYNVLFEINESQYGKTKTRQYKLITDFNVMIFQTKTELINQTTSMVAQMLHTKVLVNGKSISLFNAYNNKGNLVDGVEDGWNYKVSKGGTENKFTKFRNHVIQVNKIIHGNYDPNSPLLLKKYAIGRMFTTFRTWMPEGFATRFQKERYDKQLGRSIKGRYRTYGSLGFKSIPILFKQLIYSKNAFINAKGETMKDVDIENMRRNLAEIIGFGSILLLGLILKSGLDWDDDEKIRRRNRSAGTNLLINVLFRTQQDVKFYLQPSTFKQIMREPIPAFTVFSDYYKAIEATINHIMGKRTNRGTTPLYKWAKATPIARSYTTIDFQTNELIEDKIH